MSSTLRMIAKALGGEVAGRNKVLAPGPGHSSRDRSLSVLFDADAPDGFRVNSFAGDDWRICRDHVCHALGIRHGGDRSADHTWFVATKAPLPEDADAARRIAAATAIWEQSVPIAGTSAETYLHHRIGIVPEGAGNRDVLRFHPACPFRLEDDTTARLPALVAAMSDIRTSRFRGIHRTALRSDGTGKSVQPGLGNPKRMLGLAKGACVRLSPDDEVTTGLHIAEGIETGLACMAMGFAPLWAALSAGGIASFPVLSGVEALTIFADHDASGAGLAAARACARRWTAAGCEVRIRTPRRAGSDWADCGEREA